MIAHQAEALILRTWPVHEADQIVSLFTRDQGKLKGIAKSAAKSRRRFGGALEPMTYVLASYVEKPRQELVRLDSCEILSSPLSDPVDYARAAPFRALCAELGEDPAMIAHRYALGMAGVDTVVLGVKNRAELRQCLEAEAQGALDAALVTRIDGLGLRVA